MNKRLKFEIGFEADPDRGTSALAEDGASWGWFRLTVDDKNLCQHVVDGHVSDRVHWYLLPMLEWLIENWDPLLHESRMPAALGQAFSARQGFRSFNPYKSSVVSSPNVIDGSDEDAEEAVYEWSQRHAFRSSAEGGIFPDIFIRRVRNEIEFSWGNSRVEGAPADLQFLAGTGHTLIPPREVADGLFGALKRAVQSLVEGHPNIERFRSLSVALEELQRPRSLERAAWMTGIRGSVVAAQEFLIKLAQETTQQYRSLIVPVTEALVISHPPAAVAMFGSLAPDVNERDVRLLLSLLEDASAMQGRANTLPRIDSEEFSGPPHQQGYGMADLARKVMGIPSDSKKADLRQLFLDYGIVLREVALSDAKVRAVAIRGAEFPPLVAVNETCRYNDTEPGLRFTLAHELCHLLFDEEEGVPLTVASGPWAPASIEKRANAFAAMFLMPEAACRSLLGTLRQSEVIPPGLIEEIAAAFGTGKMATLHHLENLHLIDTDELEDLSEQLAN